jgi:hypothetical protein
MDPISGSIGDEVTVAVSDNNQISASIGTISAEKIIYAEGDADEADIYVDDALDDIYYNELATINGDISTVGSMQYYASEAEANAKQYADETIGDAIEALDTSTDVAIASVSGDTITLQNGVKQEDGLIAQGTGDGITISPIGTTSINSLFSAS